MTLKHKQPLQLSTMKIHKDVFDKLSDYRWKLRLTFSELIDLLIESYKQNKREE